MVVLFLIVFLGLLGFGLILPVLPFMVEATGATPTVITITLALYSLGQMIGAPIWGRLSDRYGRCTALILTTSGTGAFYAVLGLAQDLWLIMAARFLCGFMAGNIAIAYAYIADTRTGDDRAKAMGFIGAAFSLGFIFGPAMGGLLSGVGFQDQPFLLPSLVAGLLYFLSTLGVVFFLKEPKSMGAGSSSDEIPGVAESPEFSGRVPGKFSLRTATSYLQEHPVVVALIATNLVVIAFWALLESIFSLWANRVMLFSPREVALYFTYIGVVGAVVQGFAVGPLIKSFGETVIVRWSIISMFLGFILIGLTDKLWLLFLSTTLLTGGHGLFNPSLTALISHQAPERRQGLTMGVNQGAGSLGRVIGPMVSGFLFTTFGASAPYFVAAAGMVVGFVLFAAVAGKHLEPSPLKNNS